MICYCNNITELQINDKQYCLEKIKSAVGFISCLSCFWTLNMNLVREWIPLSD